MLSGPFSLGGHSRASNTARRCVFDNCRNAPAHVVPTFVKFNMLKNHNYYIPPLVRVCHPHTRSNEWDELLLQGGHHDFSSDFMLDIINIYKWGLDRKQDFENLDSFDDNEFHFWTSMTKTQFTNMLDQVPSLRARSRNPATVLGIFLCKVRTGEPNERLATLFKMSRRALEKKLRLARQCLTQDFVPLYLGVDHISRTDVVARNLTIPDTFFGNEGRNAVVICDGTYIYLQKSMNFLFQRKSYSLHKFRNLLKPFLIVCADGYIIDVYGPYAATTSDATILRDLLTNESQSGLEWFFQPNDAFIFDRGFRDAVPNLEECGFVAHMPPTRARGQQLTTMEANKSRLITICRWVVEAINGRIKRDFKIFRQCYFNVTMKNMMVDIRICAAMINANQQPYSDNERVLDYIEIINEKMHTENTLAEYVLTHNINRQRATFQRMEASSPELADFPRMTYEELLLITLGIYHLKLARAYCHEHLRQNNNYMIELYRHPEMIENKTLIRGRIQSRHVRLRQYYTYILTDPAQNGREGIDGYYCSCIHGRRTVGCCAHIASIIFYLAWARHEENVNLATASFLDDVIIIDYDA